MARVTAYEATDGTLHRDRKVYLQHESNLVVAEKLKPIIAGLVVAPDDAARAAMTADIHDFIVNGIGLNTLRELLAFQFKPGTADGDEAGAPAAAAAAAPAAGDAAPAAGDAAPVSDATATDAGAPGADI
jgi:hypothetical protein